MREEEGIKRSMSGFQRFCLWQDELRLAMDLIGEHFTEAELNHMLELADIDKDGRINYEGLVFHV